MTQLSRRTFSFSFVGAIACVPVFAQGLQPMLGKWKMTSETDSEPVEWTLTVSGSAEKPVATLSTEQGEQSARDTKFQGGTLSFKVEYQGSDYIISLKYADGRLDGSWNGDGNSGRTHGNRAKAGA